jgi:hemerythrin
MASDEIVNWHNSYSINIPLIDAQHKELIRLTNTLYQGCLKGRNQSKDVFLEVIRGAVDYVGYHFSTEEMIMERIVYPAYSTHKKEHTDFVREVLKTVDDLSKGTNYNPLAFVHYLKDWILTHIAVSDTKLGQHLTMLKQQGSLQKITLKVKEISNRYVIG